MKIYIVTKGDYSNYHIVATFLDKSKAEKFVDFMDKITKGFYDTKHQIEEYDILENGEDYVSYNSDEWVEATYKSNTKETSIELEYFGWERKEIQFYEDYYELKVVLPLSSKNILQSKKIMQDWVAEIEYELKNTFNGDLKAFEKNYKEQQKNMPF